MKRLLIFTVTTIILLSPGLFGQERVNRSPDISISKDVFGVLKEATGWHYNDSKGKWISQSNAIPYSYYSESSRHSDALGMDNFEYYKLRELQFRGKEKKYVMLMKVHTDGTFRYPNIREGWYRYNVYHYWIFPKEELNKFAKVKDTEKNLVKIEAVHYDTGLGTLSDEKLRERIRLDNLTPKPLYVHLFPFKEKDLVQFLIFGQRNEIASGVVMGPYMGIKKVMSPEVFKEYYYETKYKLFTQLFNIDPADYADGNAENKVK